MNKIKPYPTWVCHECAYKADGMFPRGLVSTFHEGRCDVCGKSKAVTDPRDYGYPEFEGHENGSRKR